jgi:hypothetical protein
MDFARNPFDELELVGMAAALIVAALFATHGVPALHPGTGPALHVLLATCGFVVTLAPFVLRRLRRSRAHGIARA